MHFKLTTTSAETQAGTFSDNTFYLKQMLFQVETLKSFISGKDTFVILPTGYGKLVIYGVLPLMFDYLLGEYSNIKNLNLLLEQYYIGYKRSMYSCCNTFICLDV